jgi:hypothetical protein
VTIFVLDLLNSGFEDFAYLRYMVHKYLVAQPAQLNSPAGLIVLNNDSLDMVQGYMRNKADLLYALDHVPPALPYKKMHSGKANGFFLKYFCDRSTLCSRLLCKTRGVAWTEEYRMGRARRAKHLHDQRDFFYRRSESLHAQHNQHAGGLANGSVRHLSRTQANAPGFVVGQVKAGADFGDEDPFSGDINFGVFVNETGCSLFYNRNDVHNDSTQSMTLGSEYYTLTYQPPAGDADGRFPQDSRVFAQSRSARGD